MSRGKSWHFDTTFGYGKAALAWGVSLDRWEKISPEHRGQMIEIYNAGITMSNWETWVNRPKRTQT